MFSFICVTNSSVIHSFLVNKRNTVKLLLNGISRVQNIFPLKPGFRLNKVYYDSLIKAPFKTGFTVTYFFNFQTGGTIHISLSFELMHCVVL
jgi:hypothetical protein